MTSVSVYLCKKRNRDHTLKYVPVGEVCPPIKEQMLKQAVYPFYEESRTRYNLD